MLSRALILAAVTVVLGCFAAIPAEAQNLEAGKSPGQIFSATCSLCHKSPRGLLRSVSPGALPGFLRQHYTTSSDMASAMSAYVLSNGAANAPVAGGNLTRQGQEAKSGPKPSPEPGLERAVQERDRAAKGRKPHTREAVRPADADGRQDGSGAQPEAPASAEARPAEQHPSAKQRARQKAAKGRPAKDEPPPKIDARHEAPKEGPAKTEPPKSEPEKSESAKTESPGADAPKQEEAAPSVEAKPDPAPAAAKEPEKSPDTAAAAPPSQPVEDNPNRPLTIDIGPASAPPPEAAPAGSPAGASIPPVSQ
ncbi:chemotaxis protein histidine kinase CheA [Nitrobacteraceae bacterium AZCC 1564]